MASEICCESSWAERRFSTFNCAVNGRTRSLSRNARAACKSARVTTARSRAATSSLTSEQKNFVARGARVRLGLCEEAATKHVAVSCIGEYVGGARTEERAGRCTRAQTSYTTSKARSINLGKKRYNKKNLSGLEISCTSAEVHAVRPAAATARHGMPARGTSSSTIQPRKIPRQTPCPKRLPST